MAQKKYRLLIVEDEEPYRRLLCSRLAEKGYCPIGFRCAEDALAAEEEWDVALIDLRLPGMNGLELLKQLKAAQPSQAVLILTGQATVDTAIEAMKLGALDYLTKPCKLAELEYVIRNACERVALERENRLLKTELYRREEEGTLIGRSAPMQQIAQLVEKVAPTDSSVLILGESGTGKEVIARALHKLSLRATKPFLAVNCPSLPETLLENELFGHEKGAFTGAIERTRGLFETAAGGTLFLDEMADMHPSLQARLLRVLDCGEFSRVGSAKVLKTDVRVLSATNKDLSQRIAQGLFRQDLFYRLNVVTLALPALRERREDIPLLVHHFLDRVSRRRGGQVQVTPEAMAALMDYDWPGNVRELANVIERAVILCNDNYITPPDVAVTPPHGRQASHQGGGRPRLEEVERRYIEEVLREEHGNKTKAAKVLGVSLRNLYRKVEDYQIVV